VEVNICETWDEHELIIYRFKMVLLTYFTDGQVKGKGRVFPEFGFCIACIKLRRK